MSRVGYKIYENAIIVPPSLIGENRYDGKSSVFESNGTVIKEAVTISLGRERHQAAEFPKDLEMPVINGIHSYGGVFFGHFGHFITESTGRLWILDNLDIKPESIIYVPKEHCLARRAWAEKERLLDSLGIKTRIQSVSKPVRVERLIVPDAEFGLNNDLIDGTPRYVSFMKNAAKYQTPPKGSEFLYISRQGLPVDRGTILGESLVEQLLAAEGYEIWRPQLHSTADQIAQYRAAKRIISVDASPLHLYAYVANDHQKISIIKRRSMDAYLAIVRHIKAFNNPEVNVIDALNADFIYEIGGRIGRSSWGHISIQKVGIELAKQGMIRDPEKWRDLTDKEIKNQISNIESNAKRRFIMKTRTST